MREELKSSERQLPENSSSLGMILNRLSWGLVGPVLLPIVLWRIMTFGHGWLTRWDVIFFGILVVMIVLRWIDMQSGHSLTAYGEPATPGHFRRWLWILLPLALVAWVFANLLGNVILG